MAELASRAEILVFFAELRSAKKTNQSSRVSAKCFWSTFSAKTGAWRSKTPGCAVIERHLKRFSRFGGKNPAVFLYGACSDYFRAQPRKTGISLSGCAALQARAYNQLALTARVASQGPSVAQKEGGACTPPVEVCFFGNNFFCGNFVL